MSIFPMLLALWLFTHYAATLVLAQKNHTTITTTTTLVIPVFTLAPNSHPVSSLPTMTTTCPANADISTFTVTPTATMRDMQLDVAQFHALGSLASTMATNSSPSSFSTSPSSPRKAAHPAWMLPVSVSLLCYDFLAVTAFVWCWVMGYFWWWARTRSAEVRVLRAERESILGVLMNENLEWEMRRLGMA